jgi:signal transduction histidine kinase
MRKAIGITLISLFFASFGVFRCFAQIYQHLDYLSTDNGLKTNTIITSRLGSEGCLWFLSKTGFTRYDGRNLKDIPLKIPSGQHEFISGIVEYPANHLWIISSTERVYQNPNDAFSSSFVDTIFCYNTFTEKQYDCTTQFEHFPFRIKEVTHIVPTGTVDRLIIVEQASRIFLLEQEEATLIYENFTNERISYVSQDRSGDYWVVEDNRLIKIDQFEQTAIVVDTILTPLDNHKYYIDSHTGFLPASFYHQMINSSHSFAQSEVVNAFEADKSHIGFGPLVNYTPEQHLLYYHVSDALIFDEDSIIQRIDVRNLPEGLDNFSANGIMHTKGGILILQGLGIHFFTKQRSLFRTLKYSASDIIASTRGIVPYNDTLLIANSYAGQVVINLLTDSLAHSDPSFAYFNGYGIVEYGGALWSGNHGKYLIKQEIGQLSDTQKYFFDHSSKAGILPFHPHVQEASNTLFMGTNNGLFEYDKRLDSFQLVTKGKFASHLKQSNILSLRSYGDSLWIGSSAGLFLYTEEGGVEAFYDFDREGVVDVHISQEDIFWLAMYNNGVLRWDKRNGTMRRINESTGLSNNSPTCIYADYLGNLWIPTFNGLNYLNTEDLFINTFYEKDGISHNEFNYNSHLLTADSTLYLGSVNGVTAIDLKYNSETNPYQNSQIPIAFNECRIYNNKNEVRAVKQTNLIELKNDDTHFHIDFSMLDFSGEPTFDFAYRIKGLNDDWMYENSNVLQLSKPTFGRYELSIRAKGIDGRWSKEELVFDLHSVKPYYLSTWFFLLVFLVFSGLLWLFVRWRTQELLKTKERLEKEVKGRTEIIERQLLELQRAQTHRNKVYSIIGHDLRSPIVGMLNLSKKINFLIERNRMQQLERLGQQFERNLKGVYGLLNNLLDWSRLEDRKYNLRIERMNLSEVIQENISLYEEYINQKELTLCTDVPAVIFVLADKRSVATITRNLVDNAVKYTNSGGRIAIQVLSKGERVHFTIANQYAESVQEVVEFINTFTSTNTTQVTGLGLPLCVELLKMNQAELKVMDRENMLKFQLVFRA